MARRERRANGAVIVRVERSNLVVNFQAVLMEIIALVEM